MGSSRGLGAVLAIWRGLTTGYDHLSRTCQRGFTRLALRLFRHHVNSDGRRRHEREPALRSIHAPVTYSAYASKTLLASTLVGIAGSLVAVWLVQHGLLAVLSNGSRLGARLPVELPYSPSTTAGSSWLLFGTLVVCGNVVGFAAVAVVYSWRWRRVRWDAKKRAALIDESLPRTIAFIYALSRSGMPVAAAMRTVAANRPALGASAAELEVLVTDIGRFGVDLNTALERAAERTPSEPFENFVENLRNVLQSGRTVSEYLRDRYDHHRDERVLNQERVLEVLNALAEVYVAGLVAGPLFVVTVLVVAGLLVGGVLGPLQLVVYGALPLANTGFLLYLSRVASPLRPFRPTVGAQEAADHSRTRRQLSNPLETLRRSPSTIGYLAGAVALMYFFWRGWPFLVGTAPLSVAAMDDRLIQTGLILATPYAAARLLHARRRRLVERPIPDLLERLASTNEAGMTFTASLRRVNQSELGALDTEIRRLLADIFWGARTEAALRRFSTRIASPSIARMTALITNAMQASGHLGPVLRIAADEARARRRLQRTRRQEMLLYVVIIYLAFLVFLAIAAALHTVLIPAMPSTETIDAVARGGARVGVSLPGTGSRAGARGAYTLVLFHAVIIQSVGSGLVAGQMGEGNPLDGIKHAVIMVSIAYPVFLLLG